MNGPWSSLEAMYEDLVGPTDLGGMAAAQDLVTPGKQWPEWIYVSC